MGIKLFLFVLVLGFVIGLQGTILTPALAVMSQITTASMGLVAGYYTAPLHALNPGAFWRHTILCCVTGFAGWAAYALIFLL